MSFSHEFNSFGPLAPSLLQFQKLIEPKTAAELEKMAQEAQKITRRFFGKTIRMFAPLYLSNECINICQYCGFSRNNPILRLTLSVDEVEAEARHLAKEGFRSLLLVAGEHPKFVSSRYLEECLTRLHSFVPSLALEIGPMEEKEYLPLVRAGAEGLVVYQETYQPEMYRELHTAGPKQDFSWRLDCPERAYRAGFRRLGIGALFGLTPWREEAMGLARHAAYLLKHCWKASLHLSLPRLRPAAGEFEPKFSLNDREFFQLICAFRITFPQIGLVLSTRESPLLRDRLMPLGITAMSAGSHTEPGGYTGAGRNSLHQTERGRAVLIEDEIKTSATEQFQIADERSPQEIAKKLQSLGLEAVWKDWDAALATPLN